MSEIPKHLREQLRRGNVIPLIGAGVSRAVLCAHEPRPLFPDWRLLIEEFYDALEERQMHGDARQLREKLDAKVPDYSACAEFAWQRLGTSASRNILTRIFNIHRTDARPESLELARLVWGINDLLITTNFDSVLKWSCPDAADLDIIGRQTHKIVRMLQNTAPTRYAVWHLHGNILENVEELVFTAQQYDDFYHNGQLESIYSALRVLLSSKTFLFIGFSLNDVYFRKNLEDVRRIFDGATGSHYVLVKRGTKMDDLLKENVIPIEFNDFEFGLPLLVKELCRIAKFEKRKLSERLPRPSLAIFTALAALTALSFEHDATASPILQLIPAEPPAVFDSALDTGPAGQMDANATGEDKNKKDQGGKKSGQTLKPKPNQSGREVPKLTKEERLIRRAEESSGDITNSSR